MAAMSDLFAQHGYAANIRYEQCIEFDIICVDAHCLHCCFVFFLASVELYEPSLQSAHFEAPSKL